MLGVGAPSGAVYNALGFVVAAEGLSWSDHYTATGGDSVHVTYYANEGTGDPVTDTEVRGSAYTVRTDAECNFARPGFTFKGWNTQADGLGTSYASVQVIPSLDDHLVLYAQWEPVLGPSNITVYYNPNGGFGYAEDFSHPTGTNYTVLSGDDLFYYRDEYRFIGWNTETNGSGTAYAPGDVVPSLSTDLYLYAQWQWIPIG